MSDDRPQAELPPEEAAPAHEPTDVEITTSEERQPEDEPFERPVSPVPVIIRQEFARALRSPWTQAAFIFILLLTVIHLNYLYRLETERGLNIHTLDTAVGFLDFLRWGVVFVAAAVAGPSLLQDYRRGALELYYSRAVTPATYLFAKGTAVLLLTSASLVLPALLYWGFSYFSFETQPDAWNRFPLLATGYALLWTLPVAALGLGLSSVARSSGAAALLLFGGFAAADLFISNLLEWVAHDDRLQIVSPFAAHAQQAEWLFEGVNGAFGFPYSWGLVLLGAFFVAGTALVVWKRPQVGGGEHGRR